MLARPPSSPKRRFQPGLVPAALAAAIVVGAVSYALVVVWLLHMAQAPQPQPSPSARPLARKAGCPTQVLSGAVRRGLGFVAWVEGGTLRLVNLATCQQRVLVPSRAAAPIRFSPDGRWVAFGPGLVVASSGGQVEEPFGIPVRSWEWSTTSDVLAGVTAGGGLSIVAPGGVPRVLLGDGSSVRHIVFAPDGRDLALDRAGVGVQVLNVPTGAPRTILPQPDRALVPRVAGWFPDGRWVLYWRGPVRSAGGPLDAVPVTGGGWVNVWGDVLPYQDFISPCGHGVAITAGNGAALTVGKQIFLSGPPDWRFRDLSSDTGKSIGIFRNHPARRLHAKLLQVLARGAS